MSILAYGKLSNCIPAAIFIVKAESQRKQSRRSMFRKKQLNQS